MQFTDLTPEQSKRAQAPHNLYIGGIFVIDLLMTPAVIGLKIGMVGLLIPLVLSGLLIGYIYRRGRDATLPLFVLGNWRWAWKSARLLLIGYGISGALILLAWLISLGAKEASMSHILWTAMTRVALVPTFILVLVTSVMEFGAYAQAGRGLLRDDLVPPAG